MMVALRDIVGNHNFSVQTLHHWCCPSKMNFLNREKYDNNIYYKQKKLVKLEILILMLKN